MARTPLMTAITLPLPDEHANTVNSLRNKRFEIAAESS